MADLTAFENDTLLPPEPAGTRIARPACWGVLVLSLAAIVVTCAMAQPPARSCALSLCGSSSPTARTGLS